MDNSALLRFVVFCQVGCVTSPPQQALHLACPIFFFNFDEGFQLAQVMSITLGMQYIGNRVIRCPTIMQAGQCPQPAQTWLHGTCQILHHAAALAADRRDGSIRI
jgi:hypothetical protein